MSQRGGKRVGTAGRKYSNRTDLQRGPRKPSTPTVAPAGQQPFGAREQQIRSMQALPLATQPPNGAPEGAAATGAAPPSIANLLAAHGHPGLPDTAPLDRPTDRPLEPLTTGIPTGPGAGPEVLPAPPIGPDTNVNDFIVALAANNPSPELAQLADYVASNRG